MCGFVGFTSSAGSLLPGPTAMLYSSTKVFLSNFASTLSAEIRDAGIDVLCIQPGPVATGFMRGCEGLPTIEAAKSMGVAAQSVADMYFSGAGRVLIWNAGLMTIAFTLANRILDFAFLNEVFARVAHFFPDHQILIAASKTRNPAANNTGSAKTAAEVKKSN